MKHLFSLALLFIGTQLLAQDKFSISAALKNLSDKASVALSHDGLINTATVSRIVKGKFTVTGAVNFAGRAYFNITDGGKTKTFEFFLGNETVSLTGDAKNEQSIVVKNSKYQAAYKDYNQLLKPEINTLIAIVAKAQKLQSNPAGMDSLSKVYTKAGTNAKNALAAIAEKHKSSPVISMALYSLKDLYNDDLVNLNKMVTSLTDEAAGNAYATFLKSDLEAKLFGAEGTASIDFTQNDTANKPVKLSDFKGKYVLVDFWASWCRPCRMENPNVVAAYNKFKDKNFTILGVSLDGANQKAAWLNAIKDDGLSWTNVSDLKSWQNEAAKLYKVSSIPQNYLIGPDGVIVGKNLRGQALEEKLCQLLGCN